MESLKKSLIQFLLYLLKKLGVDRGTVKLEKIIVYVCEESKYEMSHWIGLHMKWCTITELPNDEFSELFSRELKNIPPNP